MEPLKHLEVALENRRHTFMVYVMVSAVFWLASIIAFNGIVSNRDAYTKFLVTSVSPPTTTPSTEQVTGGSSTQPTTMPASESAADEARSKHARYRFASAISFAGMTFGLVSAAMLFWTMVVWQFIGRVDKLSRDQMGEGHAFHATPIRIEIVFFIIQFGMFLLSAVMWFNVMLHVGEAY